MLNLEVHNAVYMEDDAARISLHELLMHCSC